MKKDLQNSESSIASLKDEINNINIETTDIEASGIEKEHTLKLKLKSVGDKKAKLEGELKQLRSNLVIAEEKLEKLTSKKLTLNNELTSVQQNLNDVKSERSKSYERTTRLATEMRTLQDEKMNLMVDASTIPLELERVKSITQEISVEAQSISTQINAKNSEIKLLKERKAEIEEVESLKEEYESQRAYKVKLQDELNHMKKQNIDAVAELGEL